MKTFDLWIQKKNGEEIEIEDVSRLSLVKLENADGTEVQNLMVFRKSMIDIKDEEQFDLHDINYFTTM